MLDIQWKIFLVPTLESTLGDVLVIFTKLCSRMSALLMDMRTLVALIVCFQIAFLSVSTLTDHQ